MWAPRRGSVCSPWPRITGRVGDRSSSRGVGVDDRVVLAVHDPLGRGTTSASPISVRAGRRPVLEGFPRPPPDIRDRDSDDDRIAIHATSSRCSSLVGTPVAGAATARRPRPARRVVVALFPAFVFSMRPCPVRAAVIRVRARRARATSPRASSPAGTRSSGRPVLSRAALIVRCECRALLHRGAVGRRARCVVRVCADRTGDAFVWLTVKSVAGDHPDVLTGTTSPRSFPT
jgi:hypothetical protein